ncbi:MAG: AraC family transcriptional regulator [Bacteroidetes bacterium]|jgi:AraC-like DNA-binding protein|nr:AraC family transcriptional regulator [Bacteroidota bacterium]MDA0878976.1 AraC family transcriptional regulator [Bacteroidota bacterium]MDA1115883.1 AraC family transcriptional regulator [Bacteroidota bacterium]
MENIAKGKFVIVEIEPGFCVLAANNDGPQSQRFIHDVDRSLLQFHFTLKGLSRLVFNEGNYVLNNPENHSLMFYNPQRDLPIRMDLDPNTWAVSMVISIKKFHALFSTESDSISFLSEENAGQKYYKDGQISPSMAIILNQLMHFNLNASIQKLYFRGKAYELLSHYFNQSADGDVEQCPFLVDAANVAKIKKAKDVIISRMSEPPSLQELSEIAGISLRKLKEGFKQIYGTTVYQFLFDYKMEFSRRLLESGESNVNEVGLKVGYSTASHFISAFKKKYGTTPKKYIMSVSS